jgi:hypothetical protein
MKYSLMLVVIFLGLLMIFGCGEADHEKAKIKFGMVKYEKQSEVCDSTGCAKIILEYPEIKSSFNKAVKDSLDNYILNTLLDNYSQQTGQNTLDEMSKIFLMDYDDTRNDFPDYFIPWEISNTISAIFNANSIVSFQSEFYHFTGGAHGNSGVYFANFNSQDGKRLALSDLLISDYEKELNNAAERIFRKDKELGQAESLEEAGYWFVDNKFYVNENFGIKDEGLVFFFNSYEIAPYAMGPTEILVPYAELKNLIKEEGLLKKIISEKEKNN